MYHDSHSFTAVQAVMIVTTIMKLTTISVYNMPHECV